MNPKLIIIDGKTYNSVDEMPEEVRKKYEQAISSLKDKDGDLIPDALENTLSNDMVLSSMKIIVDGKEFNRLEDLPPELRAKYEQAMGKLDANKNGMPDFLEGMISTPIQTTNVETSFGTETARRPELSPVSPAIAPDTSNGWRLALAGLLILLLCIALAVIGWMAFMR
jgi:hypothetical protein